MRNTVRRFTLSQLIGNCTCTFLLLCMISFLAMPAYSATTFPTLDQGAASKLKQLLVSLQNAEPTPNKSLSDKNNFNYAYFMFSFALSDAVQSFSNIQDSEAFTGGICRFTDVGESTEVIAFLRDRRHKIMESLPGRLAGLDRIIDDLLPNAKPIPIADKQQLLIYARNVKSVGLVYQKALQTLDAEDK